MLQSLRNWFEVSQTKLSRKSDPAAAIRYAFTLLLALSRYCDDPRLEIGEGIRTDEVNPISQEYLLK